VTYGHEVTSTQLDLEHLLRSAGLRVTGPRLAVLEAVGAHPHAETDQIIAAVRASAVQVSHQAVYDSLNTFAERGVVRRIQPQGTFARYELRVGDNHHHVVCRTCGLISDVDCAVGHAPCLTPAQDHGFEIDEAEVVYWGTCPACARLTAGAEPDATELAATEPATTEPPGTEPAGTGPTLHA
jgi:Fur family transcriptional regulator, stress-responsive regulator